MCASLAAALLLLCEPSPQDQQAALQAAYEELLAVSPTPKGVAAEQAVWLEDLEGYVEPADHADMIADRIEDLRSEAARDRRVRQVKVDHAGDLEKNCVEIDLKGCSVPAGGFVNDGDRRLYWQLQDGYTDDDGISARLVLLADSQAARYYLQPVVWASGGVTYDPPVVFGGGDGTPTYVAIPGRYMGTGNHNADLVFRWAEDGELVQVDNWSWRTTLDQKLPEGLGVWKGVDFNYPIMFAHSPLWRADDGNCCPNGGEVFLDFAIEDDVLVVTSAHVREAGAED